MTGLPTIQMLLDLDGDGIYETDISTKVSLTSGISRSFGRGDELPTCQSALLGFTLDNQDGRFTNGTVAIQPGTPVRWAATLGATTLNRFTGYVRTLGLGWPGGGQEMALVQVTATDVLANLGIARPMRSIYEYEVLASTPSAYYTLQEAQGSTTAGDISGNNNPTLSIAGSGTALALGATDNVPVDSTSVAFAGGKYLRNASGSYYSGAGDFSIECCFATADTNGHIVTLDDGTGTGPQIDLSYLGGSLTGVITGTGIPSPAAISAYNDGDLHHVALTCTAAGALKIYVDGSMVASSTGSTMPSKVLTRLEVGGDGTTELVGSVSHVALYPFTLDTTRIATHATIALGTLLETTDARLSRLAGYLGMTTTSLTPSGQLIGSQNTKGSGPFDALQEVVTAEGGVLYADGDGDLTMQGRYYRSLRTTPDATLGETEAAEATVVTWDTQQLVNQVIVNRTNGATQIVTAGTPTLLYPKSIDLNVPDDTQALNRAQWELGKHQTTTPRIGSATFDLLTSPSAAALFALDVGDRIRLSTMPSQMWSGIGDYTLEGGTETLSKDGWTLDTNLLPWELFHVFVLNDPVYGVLDGSNPLGY